MLSFFSKITGIKYPWPSYNQIVVRNFVSGAMENTTSVSFGEFDDDARMFALADILSPQDSFMGERYSTRTFDFSPCLISWRS